MERSYRQREVDSPEPVAAAQEITRAALSGQTELKYRTRSLDIQFRTTGIIEKLGAGGMGVVYRARDHRLNRNVALKVLPAGRLASDVSRKRFHVEALALAKLNHPHIGTIYDFDTDAGIDFLVMEYVPGRTLSGHLAQGPLPETEVVSLAKQMVAALEEAHQTAWYIVI